MQSPDYHTDDDAGQPQFTNPRIEVTEHRGAPLLSWSGIAIIQQLMERLGVARALDAGVRVLHRCKWYTESDHILTVIYNMLTGGSRLSDINRLREDPGVQRVLGTERIPHATTVGDFLARFGEERNKVALSELREVGEALQQDEFALLPRERRAMATIDMDSSIHEVYGKKKEGADYAYDNTWSYNALYGTLAETGEVLYIGLREGCRYTSYGTKEVLPGIIDRVGDHFRAVRMRGDSGISANLLWGPTGAMHDFTVRPYHGRATRINQPRRKNRRNLAAHGSTVRPYHGPATRVNQPDRSNLTTGTAGAVAAQPAPAR